MRRSGAGRGRVVVPCSSLFTNDRHIRKQCSNNTSVISDNDNKDDAAAGTEHPKLLGTTMGSSLMPSINSTANTACPSRPEKQSDTTRTRALYSGALTRRCVRPTTSPSLPPTGWSRGSRRRRKLSSCSCARFERSPLYLAEGIQTNRPDRKTNPKNNRVGE